MEASGGVPRGEKMLSSGTNPESYITEYILIYEDEIPKLQVLCTNIAEANYALKEGKAMQKLEHAGVVRPTLIPHTNDSLVLESQLPHNSSTCRFY